MSYLDDTLLPGEQVAFRTYLHWVVFARAVLVGVPGAVLLMGEEPLRWIGVGLMVFAAVLWIAAYFERRTSEFAVTNKRIIVKVGILQRRTVEMLLRQVEALEVNQDIVGRMFDYGTLVIVGTGGTREPFLRISDPLGFRRAAQAASAQ